MDSASKRKATAPPGVDGEQRAVKRHKGQNGADSAETPETTTEVGLKFLETLKNAKDKTGRPIIDEFLTLPDRKAIPQYYQAIRLPISIETMEAKLRRRGYNNLTEVESDLKRMVANAKQFNDRRSLIVEDSERVRKTASNFMTRYNPAYKIPGYTAFATPIPDEDTNDNHSVTPNVSIRVASPRPTTLKITAPSRTSHVVKKPVVVEEEEDKEVEEEDEDMDAEGEDDLPDFTGKTFQEAQDQIMEELLHYEDAGLEIFTPFANLPPRSLADYYQIIRYPVCLKSVQKKVKGVQGRNAPTGKTLFQSWDSFEEEFSYIWRNAQDYNEDGSEIFNLASELKDAFKQRLFLAKSQVEQPAQPTIKLKMGSTAPKQSIKLKFNASNASPAASSPAGTPDLERSTPGVIVHNEALERQQQMVAAGMNGGRQPSGVPTGTRNPFGGGSRSGSTSTPIPALNSHTSAASPPAHTNGVKSEVQPGQSPALSAIRPNSSASGQVAPMHPPNGLTRQPSSGSPHPQLQPSLYPTSNNYHYQPPTYNPPNGFIETKARPAGQTAANSILPSLTFSTHPALGLSKPFALKVPAHPENIQQSITITLPSTHYFFQITPHIPVGLTNRPYRIFVTVNGQRMSEYVKPGAERDKSRPLYEARLEKGMVSRVEVEVLAGKGTVGKGGKEDVDWERCTLFVHVMRQQ